MSISVIGYSGQTSTIRERFYNKGLSSLEAVIGKQRMTCKCGACDMSFGNTVARIQMYKSCHGYIADILSQFADFALSLFPVTLCHTSSAFSLSFPAITRRRYNVQVGPTDCTLEPQFISFCSFSYSLVAVLLFFLHCFVLLACCLTAHSLYSHSQLTPFPFSLLPFSSFLYR